MKRILMTMALSSLVAISAHSTVNSDYIPGEDPAPPIELISVPRNVKDENVPYLVMVHDAFKDTPVMIDVAHAESSFNPTAKNPASTAKGLFQILDSTWKDTGCEGYVYYPQDNIACAQKIQADAGTAPWNSSKENWQK